MVGSRSELLNAKQALALSKRGQTFQEARIRRQQQEQERQGLLRADAFFKKFQIGIAKATRRGNQSFDGDVHPYDSGSLADRTCMEELYRRFEKLGFKVPTPFRDTASTGIYRRTIGRKVVRCHKFEIVWQ
jgi:hypothetical protein